VEFAEAGITAWGSRSGGKVGGEKRSWESVKKKKRRVKMHGGKLQMRARIHIRLTNNRRRGIENERGGERYMDSKKKAAVEISGRNGEKGEA